ncbi:MAG: 1-deoxy-D-xylulose-5-phosphate reductoisomerase [Clostridiales bacterium]|nr:1-deoxy-D-xylulose-5-phosphate reductoisomerase [Clostridiales bacterium]
MKNISILGSTGSIGSQSLDIIRHNSEKYKVVALSCAKNIELLMKQMDEFKPEAVAVKSREDARRIQNMYKGVQVYEGPEGLKEIASMESCHTVINSLMGMRGLEPTMAAIEAGKDIAFANKETLVAGGQIVMDAVKRKGVKLLPVDSEHSAIFQSLQGCGNNKIKRIILTASGGPFRGYTREQLGAVTLKEALAHPNWTMGSKITIDSASMMNKGLEVIEAKWLFDVPIEKIQIVVHPQSILHSAVEYEDGSVIGQMGNHDMKIPIAYALSYPDRLNLTEVKAVKELDFFGLEEGMTFYPADREVFKTIDLAYEAARLGGSYPVVLNGANEVLVDMFLRGMIKFTDIQDSLVRIMDKHLPKYHLDLEGILEEDLRIREEVRNKI